MLPHLTPQELTAQRAALRNAILRHARNLTSLYRYHAIPERKRPDHTVPLLAWWHSKLSLIVAQVTERQYIAAIMPAGGYHPKRIRGQVPAEVENETLAKLGASNERMLPPPLRIFGRWLAEKKRPIRDQLAKLFDITGETWTLPRLNELKQLGPFREYTDVMHERGIRAAKERLGEVAFDAVEGLAEGIGDTRSTKDWAVMSKLTGQVLERAIPRREDLAQQNLNFNIVFSMRQRDVLEAIPIEIESEVVPPDPEPEAK